MSVASYGMKMNLNLSSYVSILYWFAWLDLRLHTHLDLGYSLLPTKPLGCGSLLYYWESCPWIFTTWFASYGNKSMIEIMLCICPTFDHFFFFAVQPLLNNVFVIHYVGSRHFMLCYVIMLLKDTTQSFMKNVFREI